MKEYKNTEITAKHVICHNNTDVFHYSVVEPNDGFVTGQPFVEIFDSEEEAKEGFPQVFPENNSDQNLDPHHELAQAKENPNLIQ